MAIVLLKASRIEVVEAFMVPIIIIAPYVNSAFDMETLHMSVTTNLTKLGTNGQSGNSTNPSLRAYLTEHEFDYDPQAFSTLFLPNFGSDSGWFMDIGATNHVTNGIENLDSSTAYSRPEGLAVGDGKKLVISKVCLATLPSLNSCPLKLNLVLHVPTITKNLVSVSQLTNDNYVFLEFQKSYCFVKDKHIGKVLLKGTLKDGMYVLEECSTNPNQTTENSLCPMIVILRLWSVTAN
uniref:Retrovirus-related Pol polyprotein from transposon TNT 1-94-like beta-barrel domain-containing protein n=1 Tax=Cannabis sativa TaxID=3483 RepID=A0A803Q264_CANSA